MPTDEQPSTQLARPATDPLGLAAAENAARIAWVQDLIALMGYTTVDPPHPWAGRDDIMAQAAGQFGLSVVESGQLVDAAVIHLHSADREDSLVVQKRLALIRLYQIRDMIMKGMKTGRKHTQYKFEERENTKGEMVTVRVPWKEQTWQGCDLYAISQLLNVEKAISELQGLKGVETGGIQVDIIQQLERADGEVKRRAVVSLAQEIRTKKVSNLSDQGRKMAMAALEEMARGDTKQIPSNLVDGSIVETDSDDEEGDEGD